VSGGYTGTGNIDENPIFYPESFILDESSPCVDAGNELNLFNDPEDPGNPGFALFPSRGGLHNDMGAYGGPFASIIPFTPSYTSIFSPPVKNEEIIIYPNPSSGIFSVRGSGMVEIRDARGRLVYCSPVKNSLINLGNKPEGMYFLRLSEEEKVSVIKLILRR
jgi:hypothetical protein